jgi:pimeloyl-ACP methyl ester carboxylesterase
MTGDAEVRRRHADTLTEVEGMVLFSPADVAIPTEISSFMTVLSLTGVKIRLGQVLGVVNDQVRTVTREAYHVRPCATREQAERFGHGLTDLRHLRAAQAMIRSAVPWLQKEHRPDWPGIKQIEAGYRSVDVPCVITWGEWDETLTECMGHKIRDKVPLARLVEIEGAGHCLPSEVPVCCARIIETTESLLETKRFKHLAPVTIYGDSPFPDVTLPRLPFS